MKLDRQVFVRHLERVACNGQVSGAVFADAFAASALTQDQLLFVAAPPLEAEALPADIGVGDLPLLIKSLGVLAGSEEAQVDVSIADHRLVLDEHARGRLELMTAAPSTIATQIDAETAETLTHKVDTSGPGIALPADVIGGIQRTFSLLKAEEVELIPGPDGGQVVVGGDNTHRSKFPLAGLRAESAYHLLFGKHLVDVLTTINHEGARLYLTGPDSLVMITDPSGRDGEPYRYVLSPRARGAEDT